MAVALNDDCQKAGTNRRNVEARNRTGRTICNCIEGEE